MTYLPGKSPCYRCLYPESPEDLVPNCATAGVLGVLPGVMGSLQATEALKLLLGIGETLAGRLLVYDALSLRFDEFRFARRTDCAVCGEHPTITSVAHHEEKGLSQVAEWTPQQLAAELEERRRGETVHGRCARSVMNGKPGRLPGSVHIPLGTLPRRLDEIPADVTPVFICAVGGRSMRAAQFFVQSQGRDAINLDRWRGRAGARCSARRRSQTSTTTTERPLLRRLAPLVEEAPPPAGRLPGGASYCTRDRSCTSCRGVPAAARRNAALRPAP